MPRFGLIEEIIWPSGCSSLKSSSTSKFENWFDLTLTMDNSYDELSKSKDKSITKVWFNLGNNAHKK